MFNRKHKLPATFIIVCIIGLTGFKDTSIFVKEYASIEENQQIVSEKKYEVINEGDILNKSNGLGIRSLNVGEIVQAISFDSEYGIFITTDGIEGYINLNNVEFIRENSTSYGISKVNKIIKEDTLVYSLVKGETVFIKDFKDNMYIVVDENGNEFKINSHYIKMNGTTEKASRGNISRKSSSTSKLISAAYNTLGKPYVSGDTGKNGYDCSGLTYSLYLNNLGIKLNRSSRDQIKNGVNVKKEELMPGDLVFFRTSGSDIGHVGLYIGDGNMIHASSGRKQVTITAIDENYYRERYVGATRVMN